MRRPTLPGRLSAAVLARRVKRLRRRNEKLAGTAARLRADVHRQTVMLASAGEAIYGLDTRGLVTFANPAAEHLLGYGPGELVGRAMHAVTHHSRADGSPFPIEDCPIYAAFHDGRVHRETGDVFWRKDGTSFPIAYTSTPIRVDDHVDGAVVVFRDLTEETRAGEVQERRQAALLEAEKLAAMGTLLAGVAHELNNPLAVVCGQASLLKRHAGEGPLAARAEQILTAAERCARIVNNFLSLARQQPTKLARVSIDAVVKEAVDLVAYPLRVESIPVEMRLAGDLPPVWADAHQIHQVVVNLITNAHHALRDSPPPRRITVSTRHDTAGGRVVVEVADTGPGIPADILNRVFDPFFTTKPAGQGTGLGLPLCRGILESHGGRVLVDSTPGHGATFRFDLPVAATATAAGAGETSPTEDTRRARILVVDDEAAVADLLADLLSDHHVDVAYSGVAALQRLGSRSYDLILSDVRMPELDAPGLYRELQRSRPELLSRIVFVTGDALSPDVRAFFEQTQAPVLAKPFDFAAVLRVVDRMLNGGQS